MNQKYYVTWYDNTLKTIVSKYDLNEEQARELRKRINEHKELYSNVAMQTQNWKYAANPT